MTPRLRPWLRRAAAVTAITLPALLLVGPVTVAAAIVHAPPRHPEGATPADRGLDHQDVVLRTSDGPDLRAWWLPSTGTSAVVLVPAMKASRSSVLDHAAMLVRAGHHVLVVEPRGSRPGSRRFTFGWDGAADVAAAVDHLEARPEVDPGRVAGLGLSLGGETLLRAAAADPRLAAVVAEGAGAFTCADTVAQGDRWWALVPQAVFYRAAELLARVDQTPLVPRVHRIAPRPTLLVSAGTAAMDERAITEVLAAAQGPSARTWEVPGAGHVGGLAVQPTAYEQRVTAFLHESLS